MSSRVRPLGGLKPAAPEIRAALALLVLLVFTPVAGATVLSPFIDLQEPGLAVVEDGAGLRADGTATIQLTIPGTVRAALLYWNGRDVACPEVAGSCVVPFQPYLDQELIFDGTSITGTLIGTEEQPTLNINNIGYFADVTSLVSAGGTGLRTFSIADGNGALNFDIREGVSLIVLYTDPSDPATYRVQLSDGLDFAWASDPDPGDSRVTAAVTFNHGAQAGARAGEVFIVAGDGDGPLSDQLDISGNASLPNTLDQNEGPAWDSESHPITIAGGVASTTVQLLSNGATPDDFLWEVAALRTVVAAASPTFQFTSATYMATEESGSATVTITRTSSVGPASVIVTVFGGTATDIVDFPSFSMIVNFADGVSSVDVPITIIDDPIPEGTETINVVLSDPSPTYLLGTPFEAVVSVTDADLATAAGIPALSPLSLLMLAIALVTLGSLVLRK